MKPNACSHNPGLIAAVTCAFSLLLAGGAYGQQWQWTDFSTIDPVLTFDTTGTTGNGFSMADGVPGASDYAIGRVAYGNIAGIVYPNYRSYLSITFARAKRAIGAYVMNSRFGFGDIGGATLIAYDSQSNVVGTVSAYFTPYDTPPFLGVGSPLTNINRAEWRYLNPGWMSVDNVIFEPGDPIVLTNPAVSAGGLTFNFQTLPGRTNTVQMRTNATAGNWSVVGAYVGSGGFSQVAVPLTNGPQGFVRIRIEPN